MLKLLHLGDLHLDSRFAGISASDSANRRKDLRDVFKNALSFAKNEGCAAVLISGDLFDSEYYTADTVDFLASAFSSMPKCKFIITPGNHDPYNSSSPYRLDAFPPNVHIFRGEEISFVTFDELKLTVYGYAFTSSSYGKAPLENFVPLKSSGFNVLCAHTELDNPVSSYAPISSRSLGFAGFDYAALGHIHTLNDIKKSENTVYAYSGCIAGRDFSEHGEKGGILVTLDEYAGKKTVEAARIRFCPWIYKTLTVDLTDTVNEAEALSVIGDKLSPYYKTSDTEYILRLKLVGELNYELEADSICRKLTSLGVKEVISEAYCSYGQLSLDDDYSLRGEFYRILKPMLLSDSAEERKKAQKALKYGLGALSGRDIDII